jgi:hypothetical protein
MTGEKTIEEILLGEGYEQISPENLESLNYLYESACKVCSWIKDTVFNAEFFRKTSGNIEGYETALCGCDKDDQPYHGSRFSFENGEIAVLFPIFVEQKYCKDKPIKAYTKGSIDMEKVDKLLEKFHDEIETLGIKKTTCSPEEIREKLRGTGESYEMYTPAPRPRHSLD